MKLASLSDTSPPLPSSGTYIYKILPLLLPSPCTLVTVSSDDALRLYDAATLRPASNGPPAPVHAGVTCLQPFDADVCSVLTGGRDACIRCWDLRVGKKSWELVDGSDAAYLSLDSRGVLIAAGTELTHSQAAVTVWDHRSVKTPLLRYVESHNDDVTELRFHPTHPTQLLSGSTDGLVNIYDVNVVDEDDALLHIFNHGSSIHHAGFLSGEDIFALSHDETFSIYPLTVQDATPLDSPPLVFGDLRPTLHCNYVVDVIQPTNDEIILGAGSHNSPETQHLDLIPLHLSSKQTFSTDQTIRLPGGHGSEIIRSFCSHHAAQTIFTAGEDGLVKAWRIPEHNEIEPDKSGSSPVEEGKVGRKRKKGTRQGHEKVRERGEPH